MLTNVSRFERAKCEAIFGNLRTLFVSIPAHVKSEAILEQRSRALVAAAEQFRAQVELLDVLNGILDHPEVNPGSGDARIQEPCYFVTCMDEANPTS